MPIKILTYNTAMLRGAGKKVRAYDICRKIKEEDYDIVCLQEVFDEDVRETMIVSLEKKYPESSMVVKASDSWLRFEDSGLFFASKFPFVNGSEDWDFISFNYAENTDAIADKGLMGCRLDISAGYPGQELFVFNTHLQSDYSFQYPEIREMQFEQINEGINNWLLKLRGYSNISAVLFGDLNVIGSPSKIKNEDKEYGKMLRILSKPRDLFAELNPGSSGYTWDDLNNNFPTHKREKALQERLDYSLAFDHIPVSDKNSSKIGLKKINCLSAKVKKFKNDKGNDLSDHYGLEVKIDFE